MAELVTDYLDRVLPARRRLGVRWHLALSPACRRYFEQMRLTVWLLAGNSLSGYGANLEREVLARLRNSPGTPPA